MSVKREYGIVLLAGAIGAVLVLLAVRQRWAQAVFVQPKPLPAQDVGVSGNDLVPLAGALALAGLACLAAVIATGSWARRVAGGTSCWPVTGMSCAGSGRGGVKMAWAQA